MKPLDAMDKRVLNILQMEGRIANVELAKRVHLSPTPVRRLERDGYILGYRADLNQERLQCGFVTFMTVSLDRTTEDVFDKFARSVAQLSCDKPPRRS